MVLFAMLVLAAAAPPGAGAQRVDTAAVTVRVPRPPLSPRRAFLSSLVVPGYAQSVLGRPNAAALFILTEAIAILMVRETTTELRQARRLERQSTLKVDSLPAFFVNPATGVPDTVFRAARYTAALVRSRRAHLEDWIAALVANHVIAGADAFVAAHLWDVPVQVGLRSTDGRAVFEARYRW
jgi:hypothetical protein